MLPLYQTYLYGDLRPSYKMQHNLTVEGNHRQRFRDTELVEK